MGGLVVAVVMSLWVWPGCTVTEDNYKTLSFFFDGVPNPDGSRNTFNPATGEARARVNLSVHKPFEEERCSECHRGKLRPTRQDGSICLKCHERVTSEHEYMHGPVAAVACLWCHSPHESTQLHLLRDTDIKVCTQCHTTSLLNAARVPEHADGTTGCLTCHVGHGASKPFLPRSPEGGAPEARP